VECAVDMKSFVLSREDAQIINKWRVVCAAVKCLCAELWQWLCTVDQVDCAIVVCASWKTYVISVL